MKTPKGKGGRRQNRMPLRSERVLRIAGRDIVIRTMRNRRARRMTLRIDPKDDCAVLTLPAFVPIAQGLGFARSKADWLASKLEALPPLTPFRDDSIIPYLGREVLIRHFPLAGSGPFLSGNVLHVPGPPRLIPEQVRAWLIAEAKREITARARRKAAELGRTPPPVRLTDPRSRWGSCSSSGTLCFSWRLIMAPKDVLDYVVAHEVAHLEELNHGRRFKQIVARLAPQATEARTWLARMGSGLLRYG